MGDDQGYAVFNQPEGAEDDPQSPYPDFSGGQVADPNSGNATPSPVDSGAQQDTPQAAEVDNAASYGQPPEHPETQSPDLSGIQIPADDGAAQYAVQGQPVPGMNDPNGTVPIPTYAPYQTPPDRTQLDQDWLKQKTAESNENTKPSIGRKILAALSGAAITFGSRDASKGEAAIESILGDPRAQAQARWQQQEAPLQAREQAYNNQIAATQRANQGINANNTLKERNYRTQVVGQYDRGRVANAAAAAYQKSLTLQPVDPKNPFGEWQQVDPTGKVVDRGQEPPNSVKNDPQYKAQQDANEITARQKIAANSGLKPGTEPYNNFVYKIPLSTHTSINVREGNRANGQPKPMTQAQKTTIINQKNIDMRLAMNQLDDTSRRSAMQAAQDAYEQKLGMDPDSDPGHMTVNPDFTWSRGGQKVASPAAPAQAPQQQQRPAQQPQAFQYKGQTFTPGQTVMVNGKPAVIKGLNPQTGKLIVGAQ